MRSQNDEKEGEKNEKYQNPKREAGNLWEIPHPAQVGRSSVTAKSR